MVKVGLGARNVDFIVGSDCRFRLSCEISTIALVNRCFGYGKHKIQLIYGQLLGERITSADLRTNSETCRTANNKATDQEEARQSRCNVDICSSKSASVS